MIFTKSTLLLAVARGGLFQVQTVAGECSRVVHCLDGNAYTNRNGADFSSPTGKTCQEECDGECCTDEYGHDPCGLDFGVGNSFSVCADGSCTGNLACWSLGGDGGLGGLVYGSVGLVSGPSCTGGRACLNAGVRAQGGTVVDITSSCRGFGACGSAGSEGGTIGDITNSCNGYLACMAVGYKGAVGDVTDACNGHQACMRVGMWNTQFASNTILDNCCNSLVACNHGGCFSPAWMELECVPFQDGTCPAATSSPTTSSSPTGTPTGSPSSSPTGTPTGSPTPKPTVSSDILVEVGPSNNQSKEIPVPDLTSIHKCPSIVDKSNWDREACGDHCEGGDTFEVSVSGTNVTIHRPNSNGWGMNLAFTCTADILVTVGSSNSRSKEIPVPDLMSIHKCPSTVDKSNWDREACGDHCEVEDTFEVSVSGTQVTVQRPNANGWGMNLAFTCTFIGTTAPSMALTGSPSTPPSDAPSKSTSVSPSVIPSNRPSKLLSGSPSITTTAPSMALTGSPSAPPSDAPSKSTSVSPSVIPSNRPSKLLSVSPSIATTAPSIDLTTDAPTDPTIADPSASPTEPPTSSSTKAPKLVVCGKGAGCAEGHERPASEVEVHPVRCCADDEMQGNGWRKQGHCNVWASSFPRYCHEKSFPDAMQICEDAGGRLCSKNEVASRCTLKTGCGFDHLLVWSSSPAPGPPVVDPSQKFYVACAKGSGCPGGNEKAAGTAETHPVRCCANTQLGPGWKNQAQCEVWASSLVPGCHEESFFQATQICEHVGARLCTKTEVADMCTIKTGCGFDKHLVWSSSPVD